MCVELRVIRCFKSESSKSIPLPVHLREKFDALNMWRMQRISQMDYLAAVSRLVDFDRSLEHIANQWKD
jgi:hypothetical protein